MVNYLATLIIMTAIAMPTYASSAKIYVWRDENGTLVYSDSPKPGAEIVDVKDKSISIPSVDTSILDIKPKILEDNFEVVITQPENNATIRDNSGSVFISGGIKPVFKRGFTIQLYLDNTPYGKPQSHSMFALRNIDRGEHQIKMELLDAEGKVIALSKEITFYMHRVSIK